MITVLIETTIDLAIEGELLVRVNRVREDDRMTSLKMPVYLSIFALAQYVSFFHLIYVLLTGSISACSNSSWLWTPSTPVTLCNLYF